MLIQNHKQLAPFIGSIQASYMRLYNSLDVMVRKHRIPSIISLTNAKPMNQVWLEIDEYLEQLRREVTRELQDERSQGKTWI